MFEIVFFVFFITNFTSLPNQNFNRFLEIESKSINIKQIINYGLSCTVKFSSAPKKHTRRIFKRNSKCNFGASLFGFFKYIKAKENLLSIFRKLMKHSLKYCFHSFVLLDFTQKQFFFRCLKQVINFGLTNIHACKMLVNSNGHITCFQSDSIIS